MWQARSCSSSFLAHHCWYVRKLGAYNECGTKAIQLTGKLHFGYIYGKLVAFKYQISAYIRAGLAFVGTILLHHVLSLMSPPVDAADVVPGHDHGHSQSSHLRSSLTYPRSASVLGYCLLPLVLVAILGIAIPLDGLFGYLLTSLAIAWCAYASSSMFTVVGKYPRLLPCGYSLNFQSGRMTSMRGLVAYPMVLFYGSFGIMAIFSSRGTGQLAAKAAGS